MTATTQGLAHRQDTRTGWLMALPVMILLVCFLIVPFILAFGYSFTNQRLVSPNPTQYVGMRNFRSLLTVRLLRLEPMTDETGALRYTEDGDIAYPALRDITRNNPEYPKLAGTRELYSWYRGTTKVLIMATDVVFIRALINTLFFVAVVAPTQSMSALLLALLLNKPRKGINIFRTIYFVPVVISMIVVAMLWRFIYDGQNGLFNSVLGFISFNRIQPVNWLGNPKTALPAIMMMSVWQSVGFHMVIWLAGLQNIPSMRYEAASIDGANAFQQFRYITWPGLRSTAVFIFVIIVMDAFKLYPQVDVMTNGGPLDSTQSVLFQAVERGYGKQNIGGGSTISVIYFLTVFIVSFIQRRLLREKS